jgi:hypothetical protein
MSRLPVVLFAAVITSAAQAVPPTVTNIAPRGAERGKAVEIVVTGTNLTPKSRLILPFKAEQSLVPEAKPNPAQAKFKLTVDPSVPLGAYPAHLVNEEGLSSMFFFCVDAFPSVNEVEDNNTFEKAQKITIPAIVSGQCAGGDVDFFRFEAKKGQRLVLEVESARLGSGVLPQLRLTDGERRFIAADDSQSLQGDVRLVFNVPTDGSYVVELSDSRYRGVAPPHYRLVIAECDFIEEVFPLGGKRGETVGFTVRGGTLKEPVVLQRALADQPGSLGVMPLSLDGLVRPGLLWPRVAVGDVPERLWIKSGGKDPKALDVLPPITINSRLERKGDTDRFQFPVQPGERYRIRVQAEAFGSRLDGVLRITDQTGKQVALVDDVDLPAAPGQQPTRSADPALDIVAPPDARLFVLELRDQRLRGGLNFVYRLTIEPALADFEVVQPVSELNVPRGGTTSLVVPIVRRGFNDAVDLVIPTLPAGITAHGGHIPAGSAAGVVTISAAASAPDGPVPLRLQGKAKSAGKELVRDAVMHLPLSRESGGTTPVFPLSQFLLGMTSAEPFAVQGPATLEVVEGYTISVPVQLTRAMKQEALVIEVSGSVPGSSPQPGQAQPPAALVVKPANAAANVNTATLSLTAPVRAPVGVMDLLVQGKARVGPADRIVFGVAIPLTVQRPFVLELASADIKTAGGQMPKIVGQIKRHPVFKEPVQLRLEGLPAGVTPAGPIAPIAPAATTFEIPLKVAPKAAAVTGNVKLTATATINGAQFVYPPVTLPIEIAKP